MKRNELKHYGVPGMKWGHIKDKYKNPNRSQRKAFENIENHNARIKEREAFYKGLNNINKQALKYRPTELKETQVHNKNAQKFEDIKDNYQIQKNLAKLDKNHKNSEEYKQSKSEYRKQRTQELIYGQLGTVKIKTAQEMGKSTTGIKAKTIAGRILKGLLGATLVSGVAAYSVAKYRYG